MKDDFVQFVFAVIAIVVSAAAEELLPSFFGMGLPLLLALVMVMASRMNVLPSVMAAVGAGAFEDALSALPPMTSVCFFVIAALLAHRKDVPRPFLIALFPAFELWTGVLFLGQIGEAFVRALAAFPLGVVALAFQFLAVDRLGRKAGIDE